MHSHLLFCLSQSLCVCQFLGRQGIGKVIAVRPGSIVASADLDFESDEDEDGNALEVCSPIKGLWE